MLEHHIIESVFKFITNYLAILKERRKNMLENDGIVLWSACFGKLAILISLFSNATRLTKKAEQKREKAEGRRRERSCLGGGFGFDVGVVDG